MKDKTVAIVLSGGKGKRMGTSVSKQYLLLEDKPILYYSLKAFDNSNIDEIIIVAGKDDIEFVTTQIVNKYNIKKVTKFVAGGKERYNSVYNGLCSIDDANYVLIHDGARPFIETELINKCIDTVKKEKACIVGMPVKDTIKIVDKDTYVKNTPSRSTVWQIQTPQCFEYSLIKSAYESIIASEREDITDDSMVMEAYECCKIKVLEGSYTNIKITTPEDILVGKTILKKN